ncbi:hypothetical protein AK812_SmicGene45961, partial [Symbiodinium microadriaticum]
VTAVAMHRCLETGEGLGPEDPQIALKQRLLDLTKKNRRLQVSVDGQRVRLQQLEAEAKRPKEEAKKLAEEMVMQNAALLYGEGGNVEDLAVVVLFLARSCNSGCR